jgi:flagellar hook-associated protein 3 FlgL
LTGVNDVINYSKDKTVSYVLVNSLDDLLEYLSKASIPSNYSKEEQAYREHVYNTYTKLPTYTKEEMLKVIDKYNLDAIASALEEYQTMIYDLMNTKTSEGEYIFSGNQSINPTMELQANGKYVCNADAGFRQVKVSPSVQITTSDSGLSLFQQTQVARTATSDANSSLTYKNVETFNEYVNKTYDSTRADNSLTMTYDGATGEYVIESNWDGAELQRGTITAGNKVLFNGLEIDLHEGQTSSVIELDPPMNDNVLNSLTTVINALRDTNMNTDERNTLIAQGQVNVSTALENINVALGHVGSRLGNIETVISSNESLNVIKQESLANIKEVDVYEAVSNLLKEQNALNVAQQTFSKVNGTSLFDYIR